MRCWIDPREVGDLAVFLASEKAKHITGQFIAVDGHTWNGKLKLGQGDSL